MDHEEVERAALAAERRAEEDRQHQAFMRRYRRREPAPLWQGVVGWTVIFLIMLWMTIALDIHSPGMSCDSVGGSRMDAGRSCY